MSVLLRISALLLLFHMVYALNTTSPRVSSGDNWIIFGIVVGGGLIVGIAAISVFICWRHSRASEYTSI